MCDNATTPQLRTYTVRFAAIYGQELPDVRVDAQGFTWTRHDTLELWRRIPAGQKQIVGQFQADTVVDVYEDAAA